MSDIDNVALGMGLLAASLPGTTTATAAETAAQNEVLKKTVIRTVGADSASATTGTFPIFRAPYACYVLGATLMADATISQPRDADEIQRWKQTVLTTFSVNCDPRYLEKIADLVRG